MQLRSDRGTAVRAIAAGAAFALAACCGVLGALVAAAPSVGLWVALGVLVIAGAALQGVVTASEHRLRHRVVASGAGAVAVGGSAQAVRTKVHRIADASAEVEMGEVVASGPGAVSIGGEATGPIETEIAEAEGPAEL